jgi:hypothetical protein
VWSMSSTSGRRKRAAPRAQHTPDVPVDHLVRNAQVAGVLLISQAQESMTARREAEAAHHEQQREMGAQWNRRSRAVAVLGAPGMGFGENVLPYLRRSVEGLAVHATSRELGGACRRRRKWPPEVLLEFVDWSRNV